MFELNKPYRFISGRAYAFRQVCDTNRQIWQILTNSITKELIPTKLGERGSVREFKVDGVLYSEETVERLFNFDTKRFTFCLWTSDLEYFEPVKPGARNRLASLKEAESIVHEALLKTPDEIKPANDEVYTPTLAKSILEAKPVSEPVIELTSTKVSFKLDTDADRLAAIQSLKAMRIV